MLCQHYPNYHIPSTTVLFLPFIPRDLPVAVDFLCGVFVALGVAWECLFPGLPSSPWCAKPAPNRPAHLYPNVALYSPLPMVPLTFPVFGVVNKVGWTGTGTGLCRYLPHHAMPCPQTPQPPRPFSHTFPSPTFFYYHFFHSLVMVLLPMVWEFCGGSGAGDHDYSPFQPSLHEASCPQW